MSDFTGAGAPLSQNGVEAVASSVSVGLPELLAVLTVETSGCGFLADRRPKILFERHVFSRLTSHRFDADDPDVSQPSPGGYGPSGAHQYERLGVPASGSGLDNGFNARDESATNGSAAAGGVPGCPPPRDCARQ
jgi:hypothetical protein